MAVAFCSAYKKPEQAALTSHAAAPIALRFFCTKDAVFATKVDGLHVANKTRSISSPLIPAQSKACCAATVASSAVETWLILRSAIPVLVFIHSSFVSTTVLKIVV